MRILIVDDHPMFVAGMKPLLAELDNKVEVVTASSCAAAVKLIEQAPLPALILLDLTLPGKSGFTVLRDWRQRYPLVPIVILSASDSLADMQRALDEGAMGFISKTLSAEVMLNALRLVLAGQIFVPQELALNRERVIDTAREKTEIGSTSRLEERCLRLTPRQRDVLKLLVEGCSNKDIGRELGCSEATVKAHVTGVLKTLGVANRTQAARLAEKYGLLTKP